MVEGHCPGQDMSTWKPEDIYYVKCAACGAEVEIWKDERTRTCSQCKASVKNPHINEGCTQWCPSAKKCVGEEKKVQA